MRPMAVAPKKLDVHVGDLVEIDGRRYEIVPDKQGGLTLEAAVTVTVAELDRRHGDRPASQEEVDSQLDLPPGDGEGVAKAVEEGVRRTYTAVLTLGEDGFVCAQIAEVPEAISQGRTLEEAKANLAEALGLAIEWRREEGEPLPEPAQVTVTPVTVPGS